jgi:hypothetical protein
MTTDIERQRFVIRAHIVRYERILTTYLTPHERAYIERRLAEENSAFEQFTKFTKNDSPVATLAQMQ